MSETPPPVADERSEQVQTRITVDDPHTMVKLLGARDELLRLIERAVVSDVHVRGNEITITGAAGDNALAERIFTELLELIEKGQTVTEDAGPEAVRGRDRPAHGPVRHRTRRHRQDLPGDGQGGPGAAGQAGQPDHLDPAGGGGR